MKIHSMNRGLKNKQLIIVRSFGTDDAIELSEPKRFTLEEALEFINDDELVEITPEAMTNNEKFEGLKKIYFYKTS